MADPYGGDRTFTGPTSVGMGPVTDQEIQLMNTMTQDRQAQLEQRAHQSYIEAMDNLKRAEQQGNFPSMSGVADAQNRLNMVRGGMGSGSTTDSEVRAYNDAVSSLNFQDLMDAVRAGKIGPEEAAVLATGVTRTESGEFEQIHSGGIPVSARRMATPATQAGALGNLPSEVNDTDSFLRNLQQKRSAQ